jgi:hypothetical protein
LLPSKETYNDQLHIESNCVEHYATGSQKEGTMDFIEKIFGIAPDGGSGVLELLIFIIPLLLIIAIRGQLLAKPHNRTE